jgi:glycosyltransferase involved in cell wall biosynthesis
MIKPQGEVSKVSVAIGTWNRIDMVRSTIHAALNQSMRPYEIVVFDDNSPDETYSLLKDEFKRLQKCKIL